MRGFRVEGMGLEIVGRYGGRGVLGMESRVGLRGEEEEEKEKEEEEEGGRGGLS